MRNRSHVLDFLKGDRPLSEIFIPKFVGQKHTRELHFDVGGRACCIFIAESMVNHSLCRGSLEARLSALAAQCHTCPQRLIPQASATRRNSNAAPAFYRHLAPLSLASLHFSEWFSTRTSTPLLALLAPHHRYCRRRKFTVCRASRPLEITDVFP